MNTEMRKNLTQRVDAYAQMAKSIAKPSLAAVAALTAADAEGAVVYGPILNENVAWAAGSNNDDYFLDIDGGGNDIRFFGLNSDGSPVFQANLVGGGAVNAAAGGTYGGFVGLPNAIGTNYSINAARAWRTFALQTLANERYDSGGWRNAALPNGQERFMGIRLTLSGQTHYGWVRIRKNSDRDWTIIRWAYEDQANTAIVTPGALPVELTSFRAQAVGGAAQLTWATATEENNAGFEVQRSEDGRTFENLAFVEGHGTTLEAQDYRFDDKTVRQNVLYYYRLKQVDYDGQAEYSDLVTLKVEGQAQAGAFYPNPAIGGITKLDYQATTAGELLVTVYNINGQAVAEWVRSVDSGLNVLDMNFSALSAGNYFVKLENGADRQYQKLVIE